MDFAATPGQGKKTNTGRKKGLGGRPKGSGPRHEKASSEPVVVDSTITGVEDVVEIDDIRESIRKVLNKNASKLEGWLEQIGQDDPLKALTLYKDLAEFIVPKLQRSDSKVDPSSPVQIHFETIDAHKARLEEKKKKLITTADDYK